MIQFQNRFHSSVVRLGKNCVDADRKRNNRGKKNGHQDMPAENKTGIKTKYIQAHILSLGVFLRFFFFQIGFNGK